MMTSKIMEFTSQTCALVVEMTQVNEGPFSHKYGVGWMTFAKTAEVLPEGGAWHLRDSNKSTLRKQRIFNYIGRNKAEGNHRGLDPNKVTGA